ncbi:hypothetical protein [Kaarinaea lacus]
MLLLTTPPQHCSNNPAVELDANQLKKWFSRLPSDDVFKTVKSLQQSIESFNELSLPSEQRLKLLEVYHQGMEAVLFSYDELRLRQLRINEQQRQSLSEDIMWLYLNLSDGYKIIVKDEYENDSFSVHISNLILPIYRAIELISYSLVYAAHSRASIPPLAFFEIHQLHRLADKLKFSGSRVKSLNGSVSPPSIARLYKKIMMFVITDPAEFQASEIFEIYLAIEPFADFCRLEVSDMREVIDGAYCINWQGNQAPIPCKKEASENSQQRYYVLDVRPALVAIKQWLQKHSGSSQAMLYEREIDVLEMLLQIIRAQWKY